MKINKGPFLVIHFFVVFGQAKKREDNVTKLAYLEMSLVKIDRLNVRYEVIRVVF